MIVATPTLDANLSVAAAMARIEGAPVGSYVVLRRPAGLHTYWYQLDLRKVQMMFASSI